MIESIALSIISGIILLIYTQIIDPFRDIERYFHRHKKESYYMLQLALTTLFLAFVFNAKYVVMTTGMSLLKK